MSKNLENEFLILKTKGAYIMNNEIKLIKLIRESDNQEEAIATAVDIILSFLEQLESSEEQVPACL